MGVAGELSKAAFLNGGVRIMSEKWISRKEVLLVMR